MPKYKRSNGFRKIGRRSFLFLVGFTATQILAEYFSITQNCRDFIQRLSEWQKVLALRSTPQPDITSQPIKINPIPPNLPPLKESPIIQTSPKLEPFGRPDSSPSPKASTKKGRPRPVQVSQKTLAGVSFYQTTINLNDPETFITLGLANQATVANTTTSSKGDEPFEKLVARYKAAVVVNGTFFSKDTQKAVMGNMVAAGKFLKYSRWENYGTTLGITSDNKLEMITARQEGQPQWNQHWFSLTCGPRLVKQGKVWLSPLTEGFRDPHVLNVGWRSAIGFPASRDKLFLVTFLKSLSLQQEAEIMKAIGCFEAMNLDGGASVGLAHKGRILLPPGRNLTNVIVVYDTEFPAPKALKLSWQRFENGDRPSIPLLYGG